MSPSKFNISVERQWIPAFQGGGDPYDEAVEHGKKAEKGSDMDQFVQQGILHLVANMDASAKTAFEIIKTVNKMGFTVEEVHMKVNNVNDLEVLFMIPEKQYLDDAFDKIYDVTNLFENQAARANVQLRLGFVPKGEYFNLKELKADGFTYALTDVNRPDRRA